jgi:hypothetical protein
MDHMARTCDGSCCLGINCNFMDMTDIQTSYYGVSIFPNAVDELCVMALSAILLYSTVPYQYPPPPSSVRLWITETGHASRRLHKAWTS